jgi:nucleotide-binding universal stress UspA family protein
LAVEGPHVPPQSATPGSDSQAAFFRTILVPLDGSPHAELALAEASRLARAASALLALVRVIPRTRPSATADAQGYLRAIRDDLEQDGVSVDTAVRVGEPATEILAEGRRHHADLIVIATHARSGRARWVEGSVAEAVLAGTPVPLLLLRTARQVASPEPLLHHPRVLVPLDGSSFSEAALPVASELAALLQGELMLFQAVTDWDELVAANVALSRDQAGLTAAEDRAQRYLQGVAARLAGDGAPPATVVAHDRPARAIAQAAASREAALIVMATHGQSGLARELPGSVAALTLRETSTPLLLVRPIIPLG